MPPSSSRWPFEHPEQLAEALREQGAAPEEIAELLPALRRLSEWQAPQPSPLDTQHLLARLMSQQPALSPVRQAIRAHQQRQGSSISWLLESTSTQVSLFGWTFWLVSVFVTLLGVGAVLGVAHHTFSAHQGAAVVVSNPLPTEELLLRAIGPFLAYLGTIVAFRGTGVHVLELELACLPSPVQLAMARLVIVLGYDLCLGLPLSLILWVGGAQDVLAMLLSWFMPLLLVAGLALLLSLRLSVQMAAALAYGSWLAFLALDINLPLQAFPLTPLSDTLVGGLGLALLALALLCFHLTLHRLLHQAA
jgi:hypothetical protein